jgi:hypothetical protein
VAGLLILLKFPLLRETFSNHLKSHPLTCVGLIYFIALASNW